MLTATGYRESNAAKLIAALKDVQHYTRYEFSQKDPNLATSWHFYSPQGTWLASIRWSQTGPTQVSCIPEVKERMR